jgi:hypothetical protein
MNKKIFLRITAYFFLAMVGLSAWDQYPSGWRHYLGLAFFFLSSLRIFMIIFSRKINSSKDKH